MENIFASIKQRKCIIISNLGLFWLKLDKMCNLFNSCEESLHWGVWKFAKYVRNCVVFWKNLHSWQNSYTTAGRDGRDKFQVRYQGTDKKHLWQNEDLYRVFFFVIEHTFNVDTTRTQIQSSVRPMLTWWGFLNQIINITDRCLNRLFSCLPSHPDQSKG